MKFIKKTLPAPVPQAGIEQAVKLMTTGHLFRYHFDAEICEETTHSDLEDEPATEAAKLESEFSCYTGHKYVIAVNSCGSALFLSLKMLSFLLCLICEDMFQTWTHSKHSALRRGSI